jgi:hypothetical protein
MESLWLGLLIYYLITRFVPVILFARYAKKFFGNDEGIVLGGAFIIIFCFTPVVGEFIYLCLAITAAIVALARSALKRRR